MLHITGLLPLAVIGLRCGSPRVDGAGEFNQSAVAGSLYDPASIFRNFGIDDFASVVLERCERPSSSTPIRRLYPATSAARMAASRRSTRASAIKSPCLMRFERWAVSIEAIC